MATERTFIAIKPDGVQRGLVGEIIKRFEQRGYKLVAMKLCRPGKEHLEKHYADLSSKVNIDIPLDHINYIHLGIFCWINSIHELWSNLCYGMGGQECCQNGSYDVG